MPLKKSSKGKGKTKKSKGGKKKKQKLRENTLIASDKVSNLVAPPCPPPIQKWLKLNLKLLDWSFMDFEDFFQCNLTIYELKTLIRKRHGQIQNIVLWKDQIKERNEFDDDSKTLEEYGLVGSLSKDESTPSYTICYNFQPQDSDNPDPILLAWMD